MLNVYFKDTDVLLIKQKYDNSINSSLVCKYSAPIIVKSLELYRHTSINNCSIFECLFYIYVII